MCIHPNPFSPSVLSSTRSSSSIPRRGPLALRFRICLCIDISLTFNIRDRGRIDSVIRHLVRTTGSPPGSISGIAVTEVRSDLAKSNTETFCLLSTRLSNNGFELSPGIGRPNCQYCLGTYPRMKTCSFRIHKLIVLG